MTRLDHLFVWPVILTGCTLIGLILWSGVGWR
jgi:hypothetical protein